jgi:hypothetical protein
MYTRKLETEEVIKNGGMSVTITHEGYAINTRHDGVEFIKYRGYLDSNSRFQPFGNSKSYIVSFEDAFADEGFAGIFDRIPAAAEASEARKKALREEAEEMMRQAQEKMGRAQ